MLRRHFFRLAAACFILPALRWLPMTAMAVARVSRGTTLKEWWNSLAGENSNGTPRYTMAQIKAIANDPAVCIGKRTAARNFVWLGEHKFHWTRREIET